MTNLERSEKLIKYCKNELKKFSDFYGIEASKESKKNWLKYQFIPCVINFLKKKREKTIIVLPLIKSIKNII